MTLKFICFNLETEDDGLSPQERIMKILKKLPLHKPGANYTTEGYPTSDLALKLLSDHVKDTGGQVRILLI